MLLTKRIAKTNRLKIKVLFATFRSVLFLFYNSAEVELNFLILNRKKHLFFMSIKDPASWIYKKIENCLFSQPLIIYDPFIPFLHNSICCPFFCKQTCCKASIFRRAIIDFCRATFHTNSTCFEMKN